MSEGHPPKNWTIDFVKPEDTESLMSMHAQSWRDTYTNLQEGITEEWMEERLAGRMTPERVERMRGFIVEAESNPENKFFKVARDPNGEVIAFVSAAKTPEEQRLNSLYLAKDYHGTGLAHQLTDQLFEWLDKERETHLGVALGNERAIHFYEKLGFELVPGTEKEFGTEGGIIEVEMIRPSETAT